MERLADYEILTAAGLSELGEGPVWDEQTKTFLWVDIAGHRVLSLPAGATEPSLVQLDRPIGFAVPTTQPGRLAIGLGTNVNLLDLANGSTTPFAELDPRRTMRCNDGKCDPTGRLWAGVMPLDWGQMTGAFYSIDATGGTRQHLEGIGCSNGLAWNATRETFYYIDSLKYRIEVYHWDAAAGSITFDRILAAFTPEQGMPDGMCIDAEGQLWVAFWNGGCLRRIDAETGAWLAQLDLPARQITSCTFGGPDLTTLYITSAWTGLSDEDRQAQPHAGAVFRLQTRVRGLPVDRFALA